jgi:hypothetical protein
MSKVKSLDLERLSKLNMNILMAKVSNKKEDFLPQLSIYNNTALKLTIVINRA